MNPEIIEHQGEKYLRINPDDIDFSKMEKVQKVKAVIAFKITSNNLHITSMHGDFIETENYGKRGDYLVFNIGESDFKNVEDRLLNCEIKIIKKEIFEKLYSTPKEALNLSEQTKRKILQIIKSDNQDGDGSNFTDFSFIENATKHEYIGREVFVARVPYNFVIKAPWGHDQFIKQGGYIIYNPHISSDNKKEVYGIEGAHDRKAGQFEKTYSVYEKLNSRGEVIQDHFQMVIRADRSPIAGIQFNNIQLAQAYERVGKELTKFLEKFVD